MKYFAYTRVSNPNKNSSQHQINSINQYCLQNDIEVEDYYQDKGSGKDMLKLSGLRELIQQLEYTQDEKCILVFEASRMGRTLDTWIKLKEIFKNNKTNIYSITNKCGFKYNERSSNAPFVQQMLNSENEYDIICERNISNIEKKRAEGYQFGVAPYGQMRNPENNNEFIINPREDRIINNIINDYENHKSIGEVAKKYNNTKIRNRNIKYSTVRNILIRNNLHHVSSVTRRRRGINKHNTRRTGIENIMNRCNINDTSSQYEVEEVLEMKIVKKGKQKQKFYLIKWVGYDSSQNTWEPEKNLNFTALQSFHS